MKRNINNIEKPLKKIFIPVIDLSIPFMLGKKYILHHNSKRYLLDIWLPLNGSSCIFLKIKMNRKYSIF